METQEAWHKAQEICMKKSSNMNSDVTKAHLFMFEQILT